MGLAPWLYFALCAHAIRHCASLYPCAEPNKGGAASAVPAPSQRANNPFTPSSAGASRRVREKTPLELAQAHNRAADLTARPRFW